ADLQKVRAAVREVANHYPGVDHNIRTEIGDTIHRKAADAPSDAVTVRIFGEDQDVLQNIALEVAQVVKGLAGVQSVRTQTRVQAPAIEIERNPGRAEQHGIKPGDVRRATSALLAGIQVGGLFQDQKIFDVVVWSKPKIRQSLSSIRQLAIDAPNGGTVRLD